MKNLDLIALFIVVLLSLALGGCAHAPTWCGRGAKARHCKDMTGGGGRIRTFEDRVARFTV
jgi:hypothetical protein